MDGGQFGCILQDEIAKSNAGKEVSRNLAHLLKIGQMQPVKLFSTNAGESLADSMQGRL